MSALATTQHDEYTARLARLSSDLRRVRRLADIAGAGDAVHVLNNAILTAQGALGIVAARLTQGRADDVDMLLRLAEQRVGQCRVLLARRQHSAVIRPLSSAGLA